MSFDLLPIEVIKPILIASLGKILDISNFSLIAKVFKEAIDDPLLVDAAILKFKGRQFIYPINFVFNHNFLVLDRDLTKLLPQRITSIALKNFAKGLFMMRIDRDIYFYRLKSEIMKKLSSTSCKNRNEWNHLIEAMVQEVKNFRFPTQIKICFPSNPSYLELIETKFLKPSKKMQALIKYFNITDLYISDYHDLVIDFNLINLGDLSEIMETIWNPEMKQRIAIRYEILLHKDCPNVEKNMTGNDSETTDKFEQRHPVLEETKDKMKLKYQNAMSYGSFLRTLLLEIWDIAHSDPHRYSNWSAELSSLARIDGRPKFRAVVKPDKLWHETISETKTIHVSKYLKTLDIFLNG